MCSPLYVENQTESSIESMMITVGVLGLSPFVLQWLAAPATSAYLRAIDLCEPKASTFATLPLLHQR